MTSYFITFLFCFLLFFFWMGGGGKYNLLEYQEQINACILGDLSLKKINKFKKINKKIIIIFFNLS